MKILYVEDDPTAREYIQKGLREHGHAVDVAADGAAGLEYSRSGEYDLFILDVMLPEVDGFEMIRTLREDKIDAPVLFLSARGDVTDRVRGLNLGADDYLVKPFAFAELMARIQAVARRRVGEPEDGILRVGDLELDARRHSVRRGDVEIDLTQKEFALLEYLMRNTGQVLSRTMITERIWDYGFDSYSNVIDVHVAHLRRKIDRPYDRKLLHTVKGVGYILEDRG